MSFKNDVLERSGLDFGGPGARFWTLRGQFFRYFRMVSQVELLLLLSGVYSFPLASMSYIYIADQRSTLSHLLKYIFQSKKKITIVVTFRLNVFIRIITKFTVGDLYKIYKIQNKRHTFLKQ